MPMDPQFLDMMPDTIQIKHRTGQDKYGKDIYGTPTDVRARVVYRMRQTFNDAGELAQSRAQVYLFGDHDIDQDDKILLPDGEEHLLVSVQRYPDQDGMYYEQLFLL